MLYYRYNIDGVIIIFYILYFYFLTRVENRDSIGIKLHQY